VVPLCETYTSREIPNAANPYGVNASHYSRPDYDAACARLFLSAGADGGHAADLLETQRILGQDRPGVPIIQNARWIAVRPEVCGVELDGLSFTLLWNVEVLNREETCLADVD
jgi:hypothetical protein